MPRAKRFCPVDGCGAPAFGRGLCSKHYQRWKRYGRVELMEAQPRRGRGPHIPLPAHLTRAQWLAWAAGFVDGEGCIHIQYRKPSRTHYLKLTVPQLNPAPLHILQSLFGGSVRPKSGRETQYRRLWIWEAAAKQAHDAIVEMRPFFVVKADEADVAVEFQGGIGRAVSGGVTESEHARRESLRTKMMDLKARHY